MQSKFMFILFVLIHTKYVISYTFININENFPQNIYPINLQNGNNLKIIATWSYISPETNNIDLYLYKKGS